MSASTHTQTQTRPCVGTHHFPLHCVVVFSKMRRWCWPLWKNMSCCCLSNDDFFFAETRETAETTWRLLKWLISHRFPPICPRRTSKDRRYVRFCTVRKPWAAWRSSSGQFHTDLSVYLHLVAWRYLNALAMWESWWGIFWRCGPFVRCSAVAGGCTARIACVSSILFPFVSSAARIL